MKHEVVAEGLSLLYVGELLLDGDVEGYVEDVLGEVYFVGLLHHDEGLGASQS